jgi:hypothetical protein
MTTMHAAQHTACSCCACRHEVQRKNRDLHNLQMVVGAQLAAGALRVAHNCLHILTCLQQLLHGLTASAAACADDCKYCHTRCALEVPANSPMCESLR